MFTIEYFKNPKFVDEACTRVDMIVKFVEMPNEVPFTATPDDVMPYGVELLNRALSGEAGPVAPWEPLPYEVVANMVKDHRLNLLEQSDYIDLASYRATKSPEHLAAWDFYRQQLRDVTSQSGYPYEVVWPTKPTI
jgi:hypothetical protein